MPETPDEQDHRTPERSPARDERTGRSAAAARMQHQAQWVELQLQEAVERGDFEDLPGFGKPIENLGSQHDPDWWLKKLVEREHITGVLPPALQLRKDDAELDARLDQLSREDEVRREVEEFNDRVRAAFWQPLGGPPLLTRERDLEATVDAWRRRRAERDARLRDSAADPPPERPRRRGLPWRRRRSDTE
ncbi:MAG: DUF1992 domain-containing protein [Nocardioidaceae bacterium]